MALATAFSLRFGPLSSDASHFVVIQCFQVFDCVTNFPCAQNAIAVFIEARKLPSYLILVVEPRIGVQVEDLQTLLPMSRVGRVQHLVNHPLAHCPKRLTIDSYREIHHQRIGRQKQQDSFRLGTVVFCHQKRLVMAIACDTSERQKKKKACSR